MNQAMSTSSFSKQISSTRPEVVPAAQEPRSRAQLLRREAAPCPHDAGLTLGTAPARRPRWRQRHESQRGAH